MKRISQVQSSFWLLVLSLSLLGCPTYAADPTVRSIETSVSEQSPRAVGDKGLTALPQLIQTIRLPQVKGGLTAKVCLGDLPVQCFGLCST